MIAEEPGIFVPGLGIITFLWLSDPGLTENDEVEMAGNIRAPVYQKLS